MMKKKKLIQATLTALFLLSCDAPKNVASTSSQSVISSSAEDSHMPLKFCSEKHSCGFMDHSGNVIINEKFKYVDSYGEHGIARVYNGKWGLIDKKGSEIVPLEYETISRLSKTGFAKVSKNGLFGLVNHEGDEVIPIQYTEINFLMDSTIFAVQSGSKWGYIDQHGRNLTGFKFDAALIFMEKNKVGIVKSEGKWGVINENGDFLVTPKYMKIRNDADVFPLAVMLEDKWGFIDAQGNTIIDHKYTVTLGANTASNLIPVSYGRKGGYIDHSGKEIIPMNYTIALDFIGDPIYALVKDGSKFGVINESGQYIIPAIYDGLTYFYEASNLARAKLDGRFGYINKSGEVAVPLIYEEVKKPSQSGIIAAKRNGKWGAVNKDGEVLVSFKYDNISAFNRQDLATLTHGSQVYPLKSTGEILGITFSTLNDRKLESDRLKEKELEILAERKLTRDELEKKVKLEFLKSDLSYKSVSVDGYSYSYDGDTNRYYSEGYDKDVLDGSSALIKLTNTLEHTELSFSAIITFLTEKGYFKNETFSYKGCLLCSSIPAAVQQDTKYVSLAPGESIEIWVSSKKVPIGFGFGSTHAPIDVDSFTLGMANVGLRPTK